MQAQRVRNHKVGAMRGGSEGPNWILLAGGAAVTALSYVIGRRQKHGFEDVGDVREGKSGKFGLANHNGNLHSSILIGFMLSLIS